MVRRLCVAITAFLLFIGLAGAAYAFSISWGTDPVAWHTQAVNPAITGVRFAEHANYDRVVFDVKGRIPAGHARYVRSLVFDGSGAPVPLKGRHKFALVFHPAHVASASGRGLWGTPAVVQQLNFPELRGIAFTGNFEGYVSFGFTTRDKVPFRVFSLHDPQRVVLDFHH